MRRPSFGVLLAALAAAPAVAGQPAPQIDIPAGIARDATRILAQQAHINIGFLDPDAARMPVRGVHGHLAPATALRELLAHSPYHARQVATDSFVIEPMPKAVPAQPAPPPSKRREDAGLSPPVGEGTSEIFVSATKRGVPLDYYPGAATIVAGSAFDTGDATRGSDLLTARIASVSSTELGPGRNKLFIRGIADSSVVGPTQATVGQYWGNSRITYSAPDPNLRLYDVARIEVLEGPQGTLYGAGSLGGVIRVVPNPPDLGHFAAEEWAGATETRHGGPGVDGGALVNATIVPDRLGLRLLGFAGLDGGYITNRTLGLANTNKVSTVGGRAEMRYRPGNDWTIDLSGVMQRISGADAQYTDGEGDGLSRASAIPQPYRNAYALADLVAARKWEDLELTTSLGYVHQTVFEQFEGVNYLQPITIYNGEVTIANPDPSVPATAFRNAFTQSDAIQMMTAEIRLARRGPHGTGWLLGISAIRNGADIHRTMSAFLADPLTGQVVVGAVDDLALTGVYNRIDELTLYGEYSLALARRTNLTAGGRFTYSWLSGHANGQTFLTIPVDGPVGDAGRTENRFLPSASLVYHPGDATTLYFRYQQGFRPGGISIQQYFVEQFDPDRVDTFELGSRYTTPRMAARISLSFTRWRNIQADLLDGFGYPATTNIGDGHVLSLGWTGEWKPLPGLGLEAGIYLNASQLDQNRIVAATSPLDSTTISNALPNVADASGHVGLTYSTTIGTGDRLTLRADTHYVGKSTLGAGVVLGRSQGNYTETSASFRLGNASRSLTLAISNLLNTRGNRFALGSPFMVGEENEYTPLRPRSLRIGCELAF